MRFSPSCRCCGVAGTVRVNGCAGVGVDGASVVVKSGATTVASGTTSGGGFLAISIAAGTYTFEVTGPTGAGFAFNTGSVAYSGGTVVRTLSADSGHVCACDCNYPIPKTLSFSDGLGTHALNWVSGTSWLSPAIGTGITGTSKINDVDFTTFCLPDGGECQIQYSMTCGGSCSWSLFAAWGAVPCCDSGPGDVRYAAGHAGGAASATTFTATNFPFSATFSLPTSGSTGRDFCTGSTANPGGGGSTSVTA
jgi:hypothetical protein